MADETIDLIFRLTGETSPPDTRRELDRFASTNGWNPSDEISFPATDDVANSHLIMEHGLETSVVITFLKKGVLASSLPTEQLHQLLSISYNHMIDWHLFPSTSMLEIYNNRLHPPSPIGIPVANSSVFKATMFDHLIGRKRNPNIASLDEALIRTVSKWKRRLYSSTSQLAKNENISALFNAVFLVRAIEDYKRWKQPNLRKAILEYIVTSAKAKDSVIEILSSVSRSLGFTHLPKMLFDPIELEVFRDVEHSELSEMFRDFYGSSSQSYSYDFFLMSKHALSRIYEHYVSVLRMTDNAQLSFIHESPEELIDKSLGGIYTPQYVARFFARYLSSVIPQRQHSSLRILDPASGSGIFPRTIIEQLCDPQLQLGLNKSTSQFFRNVCAIDIDQNACRATQLSLSLLHLVLEESLPSQLDVRNGDSLKLFQNQGEFRNSFDIVVSNPPFVPWNRLDSDRREVLRQIFASSKSVGKPDLYLAFLSQAIDSTKIGGYIFFVLPRNFLVSRNASALRRRLSNEFEIRFLADLSEISVFENVSAYVILLIAQKRSRVPAIGQAATCLICRGYPGRALQESLDGSSASTEWYDIFPLDQSFFKDDNWKLLPERRLNTLKKLRKFRRLESFADIREGMATGNDSVFIVGRELIPSKEEEMFRPFLPDKKMLRFKVPRSTSLYVFYPFLKGKPVSSDEMMELFPKTWKYLLKNESILKGRSSRKPDDPDWWRPIRPRKPEVMFVPKIITPYLVLTPRFAYDESGRYGVTRGPMIVFNHHQSSSDLAFYLLGILNSSVGARLLSEESHRYGSSYLKLEPHTLKSIAIPDPEESEPQILRQVIDATKSMVTGRDEGENMVALDDAVIAIYKLTKKDREALGISTSEHPAAT